jgi:hypothetical protein
MWVQRTGLESSDTSLLRNLDRIFNLGFCFPHSLLSYSLVKQRQNEKMVKILLSGLHTLSQVLPV